MAPLCRAEPVHVCELEAGALNHPMSFTTPASEIERLRRIGDIDPKTTVQLLPT